jgi:DNA-binding NarL/FixJ family response regulator
MKSPETSRTARPRPDAFQQGDPDGALHLTPRQLEVLALLGEGLPNKLICRQLNISAGTVKVHISCILRELGVASRLQAVVWARRHGLLAEAASPRHARGHEAVGQPMLAAASPES